MSGYEWIPYAADAAESLVTAMEGASAGEAGAAGAGAAGAGAAAAGAGAAGAGAAGLGGMTAEELAALAMQDSLDTGLLGTTGAGGAEAGAAGTAGAPVREVLATSNYAPVQDKSVMASKGLLGSGGGGKNAASMLAAQQGMAMMQPNKPNMPPPQGGGGGGGQQGPLVSPYGKSEGPYGTSAGNSLGLLSSEEKKRRLMGLLGGGQ